MAELVQANWIFLVIALVIGIAVAWWVLVANRKTRIERDSSDEAAPARRNQALIDAAPAASATPPTSIATLPAQPSDVPVAAPRTAADPATAQVPPAAAALAGQPSPPILPEPGPAAVSHDPAPISPAAKPADDLARIKGLGPKLKAQLNQMGVTSISQVAAWDEGEIDRIDLQLGRFQGRIRRDNWVEQARLLEAGDVSAYQERFGKS